MQRRILAVLATIILAGAVQAQTAADPNQGLTIARDPVSGTFAISCGAFPVAPFLSSSPGTFSVGATSRSLNLAPANPSCGDSVPLPPSSSCGLNSPTFRRAIHSPQISPGRHVGLLEDSQRIRSAGVA